jgi:hypothetical protein
MKKVLFITLIIVIATNYAFAQQKSTANKLTLGIKIGVNYSNVYDSQGENFVADPKFGLATGVVASIPIAGFFGFQPELLYSQKGFKATGTLLGSNYSYTRTTNYLDIPLLLAFKPSTHFTLLVGPQFSFLLSEKNEYTSAAVNTAQETQFNNDNVRKNTLCFTGGFDVNISNMVLGLRAGWDFQTNNGDGTSQTPRYKNQWYQATIGFRF